MSAAPITIPHRPYAIFAATNFMNVDGIFVVNYQKQFIEAQVVNDSATPLQDVRVYIEGISDPGIARSSQVVSVGDLPAGASTAVRFLADFSGATPGTPIVSFIVEAAGSEFRRIIKKIFVARVDYDAATKTYSVVTPEGTMQIHVHSAIMSGHDCCHDDKPFAALLEDVTYTLIPSPPYPGTHGPLMFDDPWWKIALAILAALVAAGAAAYDYFSDGTFDGGSVAVKGSFDETSGKTCCTKVSTKASEGEDDYITKGLYSAAGAVASVAIASDDPDLHWRGADATPPADGELTVSEAVHLKVDYPEPPSLGRQYSIEGAWDYERRTTGGSYPFSASDQRTNLHYLDGYDVDAPAVHDRTSGPVTVRARFHRDGRDFEGGELYVQGILAAPDGTTRRIVMLDDGRMPDSAANDGWYTGEYEFRGHQYATAAFNDPGRVDPPGLWYLLVIAQDMNTVTAGTDAFTAAHTIGGLVVTSQLELAFDAPCVLHHDAVIQVI